LGWFNGEKMKIALVVPWLEIGGVETFVFRLACGLKKVGYEVEIVATEKEGAWFGRAHKLQIPVKCISLKKSFSDVSHARKVGYYLREHGFSVCILNHARFAQATLAMLPDEIKVFSVIHNDIDYVYKIGFSNSQAWNVAVAVSRKIYDTALNRLPNKPIIEIMHGVEIPSVEPTKNQSDSLNVIFVGRLSHEQKGIFFLPKILKGCLNAGVRLNLTIIGDGPDKCALEAKLSESGVTELTKMLGFVQPEEVNIILDSSDVLLMPSLYEGLPITMLEASAYGCVPIVSRLRGITDTVIEDGNNGFLVEPGDVCGFVKRLSFLFHHRLLLENMKESARTMAEKRFSINGMISEYSNLIQRSKRGEFPLSKRRSVLPQLDPNLIRMRDYLPNLLKAPYRFVYRKSNCIRMVSSKEVR
jgi:glycosyltransferase involved in cell wall biosynthesis